MQMNAKGKKEAAQEVWCGRSVLYLSVKAYYFVHNENVRQSPLTHWRSRPRPLQCFLAFRPADEFKKKYLLVTNAF